MRGIEKWQYALNSKFQLQHLNIIAYSVNLCQGGIILIWLSQILSNIMSDVSEAEPTEKVHFQVLIYILILSVNYATEEFK